MGADTERLNRLLLGLQQGSAGLLQRVHPHLHLSDGNVFELTESDEKQPWVVAMDGLSTAEQILAKMMEALAGDGTGSPTNLKGIGEDEEEIDNSDTHSIGTAAEAPMPAKNVRIKSLKIKRDEEAREGMVATTAAGATAGKPFMTGGDVEDTRGSVVSTDRGKDKNKMGAGAEEEETPVATRNVVKHVSAHRTNAHNKKVEMAIRKQLLKETMASVGTSDAALEQKAKLIQQTQCALRLSTFPAPVTLPEGITLRDDPMTKTKAFLEKMPKLV